MGASKQTVLPYHLFSLWAAGWEATPRQSYGFFRIEILGSLVSIQLTYIWLLAVILAYEAIVSLINESGDVQGSLMFAVSAFGLFVNIIMAVLLGRDIHMTIPTMKNKNRAMFITRSTAMEVLLLLQHVTTTTQALDNHA
jgi:cation diffusion facilitator family transporter